MCQVRNSSYDEAIKALNSLQTNSEVLEMVLKERQKNVHLNIDQTKLFLERSGMTMKNLDSIPMIHVTGTKGKGSTCAFCESILNQNGYKTGFFSSPHLISATERIRINGHPISESDFTSHFWSVYNKVVVGHSNRPAYFKFLTILAFNIFWKENVDVAIIEVGVGGRYDCTNIISNPVACGITTLDLDHTSLLGDTLEKIAWQKAGIMKPGRPTFIDGDQTQGALEVLQQCAAGIGSPIYAVPDLSSYDWGPFPRASLGLYGAMHHKNASLALQLANTFIQERHREIITSTLNMENGKIKTAKPFKLGPHEALGLRLCSWPGRSQILSQGKFVYFLDGAHTEISSRGCRSWFDFASEQERNGFSRSSICRILIFNATRDRNAEALLTPYSTGDFDHVIFCTNFTRTEDQSDNTNFTTTHIKESQRITNNAKIWEELQTRKVQNNPSDNAKIDQVSKAIAYSVVPFTDDALKLAQTLGEKFECVQTLVTGSLYLIGAVLNIVEPDLWRKQKSAETKRISEFYQSLAEQNSNSERTLVS